MLNAILPEISLALTAALVLVVDLIFHHRKLPRRLLGALTAAGIVVSLIRVLITANAAEPSLMWGGMLRIDQAGFLFRGIFLVGALLTVLLAMESERFGSKAEFYILLLVSTLGLSSDGLRGGYDHALPGDGDGHPAALHPGRFHEFGKESGRSRLEIPAVRRRYLGRHAVRFQPAVRFQRPDPDRRAGRSPGRRGQSARS